MEDIAEEEQRQAPATQKEFHSFWPQEFPDNVTQPPYDAEEKANLDFAESDGCSRHTALGHARKFLPCHYFDMICGSSTGRHENINTACCGLYANKP